MITDSQELQVEVRQRVVDSQLLQASVYAHRVTDSQELRAAIAPLMRESVQLRVTITNQALAAAAAERVLAPEIEITFLSA
jgi:predicted NBD/HSP70 family sugar kinase